MAKFIFTPKNPIPSALLEEGIISIVTVFAETDDNPQKSP